MAIDDTDVRRVAALAQLELDDDAVERFRRQLQSILNHVAILDELEGDDTEDAARMPGGASALRPDTPGESTGTRGALSNAPAATGEYFRVPRVLDS